MITCDINIYLTPTINNYSLYHASQPSVCCCDAGLSNSSVVYSGGELSVTYTGGKNSCHGQYERQTIIRFTCDHAQDGSKGAIQCLSMLI